MRPVVIETVLALLNQDVLPVIPARGSVGASGDLAPLAHLALALIGEGEARHGEQLLSGRQVLEAARTTPLELDHLAHRALALSEPLVLAIRRRLIARALLAELDQGS